MSDQPRKTRKPRPKRHRMFISFPPEILEILQQRADENVRSISGEVIHLIKFAFAKIREHTGE